MASMAVRRLSLFPTRRFQVAAWRHSSGSTCVVAKLVHDASSPKHVVFENADCLAVLNTHPSAPAGSVVLMPPRPTDHKTILDMPDEEAAKFVEFVPRASVLVQEVTSQTVVALPQNVGSHPHLHVLPGGNYGDTLDVQFKIEDMQTMNQVKNRFKEALAAHGVTDEDIDKENEPKVSLFGADGLEVPSNVEPSGFNFPVTFKMSVVVKKVVDVPPLAFAEANSEQLALLKAMHEKDSQNQSAR